MLPSTVFLVLVLAVSGSSTPLKDMPTMHVHDLLDVTPTPADKPAPPTLAYNPTVLVRQMEESGTDVPLELIEVDLASQVHVGGL
jgi:hypothetical protein